MYVLSPRVNRAKNTRVMARGRGQGGVYDRRVRRKSLSAWIVISCVCVTYTYL